MKDNFYKQETEQLFQRAEETDRSAELIIAIEELTYQSEEKSDRSAEIIIAD